MLHILSIFSVVLLLEMYILIHVGIHIGAFYTVLAVLSNALLGMIMVGHIGLQSLMLFKKSIKNGEIPQPKTVDSFLLILGGFLLIVPGFLTDGIGLLIVFPLTRPIFKFVGLVPLCEKVGYSIIKHTNQIDIIGEIDGAQLTKQSMDSNNISEKSKEPKRLSKNPVIEIPEPIVPIDKAVTNETVKCLICGKTGKTLKRHIRAAHKISVPEYRKRFNLPNDFPLVAPSYSELCRQKAKDKGFGVEMAKKTHTNK